MANQEIANFLTAADQTFERITEEHEERKRRGDANLSRNELIRELKTNVELRAAIKEVLTDEVLS